MSKVYTIVYRYRNYNMKLIEIEFDLDYPKEKPIDLIEQMVKDNLLLGRNAEILSFNILKLLKSKNKSIFFPLFDEQQKLKKANKDISDYETDAKLRRGYGMIYLVNNLIKSNL